MLLAGPPGVGKTAVAERMARTAREDGLDVAVVRSRPDDPYAPVREAVDELSDGPSPLEEEWVSADDPDIYRDQRKALFAELVDELVPGPDDPARVLVIDDLHRADPATVDFLEYLLGTLETARLVLVGCYRREELASGSPLSPDCIPESAPVERLRIQPFGREATGTLVANILGYRDPPTEFVDGIREWTGGNPLFVREVIETLLSSDQLSPDFEWYPTDPGEIEAADAVADTVEERVAGLDQAARQLLRWAALAGDRVPVDVLATVSSLDPGGLRTILAMLVETGMFDWTEDRDGVTFRSALVREAILTESTSDDRQERHRAIAKAFERACKERDPADSWGLAVDAARHHHRAGDEKRAIEWYRTASDRARDVYAHESAIEFLQRALEIADGHDEDATLEVSERIVEAYLATGEFDEAERYVSFLRQRATSVGRRQRVALYSSRIANARGDYERAAKKAKIGVELDDSSGRLQCELFDELAMAERRQSRGEATVETAGRLRELAAEAGEWDLVARAHRHFGVVAWQRGDYDRASECHREALETLEEHDIDDSRLEALLRNNLGVFARYRRDYDRAIDWGETAVETFEAIGDRRHQALALTNLAQTHWHRGEYRLADGRYEAAAEAYRSTSADHEAAMSMVGLAELAVDRGDYDVAEQKLASVEDDLASTPRRTSGLANVVRGRLALVRGDCQAARTRFQTALASFEDIDDDNNRARALRWLGRVAIEREDPDRGRRLLRQSIEIARELGDEHGVARGRFVLGRLALEFDCGDPREHLQAAMTTFEAVGDRNGVALATLEQGRLALREGDPGAAREDLRAARDDLEAIGAFDGVVRATKALVEACQRDDEAAARWCDRGIDLIDPNGPRADDREWFLDRHPGPTGGDDPGSSDSSGTPGRD